MPKRICVLCGKEFSTKSSRRLHCYKSHFHPCPICGNEVLTKDMQHLNECCCAEHSHELAMKTMTDKYEEWPAASDEASEKRKQTCLERYGVENVSLIPEVKQQISKKLIEVNREHPEYRKKAMQTYFDKTGYYTLAANPDVQSKNKKWQKGRYEVLSSPESSSDRSDLTDDYKEVIHSYCNRNSIPITRNVPLSFEHEGKIRKTFIDFEIDGFLVEVKGEHMLDGYFDDQPRAVPISRKLQIYKENHVIVVTGQKGSHYFANSNGLNYLDKCPDPLIGVDIELFKNPEFPYREDRPKCFYDVRVSGQMSSFEAFNDEKLRWEMIKNRIRYVGGFITSKDILTALNVTRKCKQPSWFSAVYAEKIIKKYCTSDIIVDPFAGWGTRNDVAIKCHKKYIGCDLNSELVEWHKSKGRNIVLEDAKQFYFDDECDVFICPPYKDTEVYFEDQDIGLSQCEWLEVVRKNVPNANRYIMVCKVVDSGYEKYITEEKVNKSHFGMNKEYVIVIDKNS